MLRALGLSWPGLVLASIMGVSIGLGLYTFWYGEGMSYFSNDPATCANCHIMHEQYDGWMKASHHAVATCNDCHTPHDFIGKWASKASNGFWHSKGFTLMDFHEPIRIHPHNAAVLQANCIHCHKDVVHEVAHLGSAGDDSNACVRCHIEVGHGPAR